MGRLARALIDLVAPPRCARCQRRTASMDPPWCHECADDVIALDPRCGRCGASAPTTSGSCPLAGGPIARVLAPHAWTGTIAATVRAGKLDGVHAVFTPLGRLVGAHVAGHAPAGVFDLVCPVPGHPRRTSRRGFDHARMLAVGAGRQLDLAVVSALLMTGDAVDRGARRRGGTGARATTDHGRDEARVARRWIAAAGMRPCERVSGHVLLVDDVVTTATTVIAAGMALRAAGAERVTVAALARAGGH